MLPVMLMSRTSQIVGPPPIALSHTEAPTHQRHCDWSATSTEALHLSREGVLQNAGASCRLVTLAAGAAAGKFLKYEHKAPTVAAQTAYGIEVELDGLRGEVRREHHAVHGLQAAPLRPLGRHGSQGETACDPLCRTTD